MTHFILGVNHPFNLLLNWIDYCSKVCGR